MDKQEKIVCAAIEVCQYGNNGNYIAEIFCGVGYDEIKAGQYYKVHFDRHAIAYEVNGFITNKNRFVDPVEAVTIANHACQIKELRKIYAEYIEANDKSSYSDAKAKFKEYMDEIDEYKARGLKPEDLY